METDGKPGFVALARFDVGLLRKAHRLQTRFDVAGDGLLARPDLPLEPLETSRVHRHETEKDVSFSRGQANLDPRDLVDREDEALAAARGCRAETLEARISPVALEKPETELRERALCRMRPGQDRHPP